MSYVHTGESGMMPKLEMVELVSNTVARIHELLQAIWAIVYAITASDAFTCIWEFALAALGEIAPKMISRVIFTALCHLLTWLQNRTRNRHPILPIVRLDKSRLKREVNKRTIILPKIRHSKRKASRDKTPTPKRLR